MFGMFDTPRLICYHEELPKNDVLDGETVNALELSRLERIINKPITGTGKYIIRNTLYNPSVSREHIVSKQEGLKEIRTNPKLRQSIVDLLERVKKNEKDFYKFVNDSELAYKLLPGIRKFLKDLPQWASEVEGYESQYIGQLVNSISSLKGSDVEKLAKGPIFRKNGRLLSSNDLSGIPQAVFTPWSTKLTSTAIGVLSGIGIPLIPAMVFGLTSITIPFSAFSFPLTYFGAMTGSTIGKSNDYNNFIMPLKRKFINYPIAVEAYKAIGRLDELIAFDNFGKNLQVSSLPRAVESDKHFFMARNLINPLQAVDIKDYVPNDFATGIDMQMFEGSLLIGGDQRITFMSGPNSGGKSSITKAVELAQILFQSGCYIPAEMGEMSVADKIYYQVGKNDRQGFKEGGLGAQMVRSKNIFEKATPRTLIAIDDLIEGTTFEEKTEQSKDALCGYFHLGANVIYVTHHHELLEFFKNDGVGRYYKVEFDGKRPTHRVIPGISTYSHANLVAERVGYDGESIRQSLVDRGFLQEGIELRDLSAIKRTVYK